MTAFIISSVDSIKYGEDEYINKPVNISLVTTFYKSSFHHYPDNQGIPCIVFMFGEVELKWRYLGSQTELRDSDYDKILSTFTIGIVKST